MMSVNADHTVAIVWNRKLPTPTITVSPIRQLISICRLWNSADFMDLQLEYAAIRKAIFDREFNGSAQKSGLLARSQ